MTELSIFAFYLALSMHSQVITSNSHFKFYKTSKNKRHRIIFGVDRSHLLALATTQHAFVNGEARPCEKQLGRTIRLIVSRVGR
jgi:hypothetical protein